jgi:hypothetical protein
VAVIVVVRVLAVLAREADRDAATGGGRTAWPK